MTKIVLNGKLKNELISLENKRYLENINFNLEDYCLDDSLSIILMISLLHLKSSRYRLRDRKKENLFYEEMSSKIDHLFKYYLDLQDYLEGKEFLSPGEYLLILNISNFYELFRQSKYYLDLWKNSCCEFVRDALLLGDVRVSDGLISFDACYRGEVAFDLVDLFRNEFNKCDVFSLYEYYKTHGSISEREELLLFFLLGVIDEFKFSKNNYVDVIRVRKLTEEVLFGLEFLLKEDKKNKKTNQDKFKEENNDI